MIEVDLQTGPVAAIWRSDPCAVLFELAARHHGVPLALRIGSESILLFQDAAAARHIARTRPENYQKNFGTFVGYFGQSRLTADGDRWAKLQKLSQPFISATDPSAVVASATNHFGRAIDRMLATAGGLTVDPYLDEAAASVIAEVTLGFGPEELGTAMFEGIRTILRYASLVTWNLPGAPRLKDDSLKEAAVAAHKRLREGLARLKDTQMDAGAGGATLLGTLIEAGDDVDLFGEICTLIFAGSDTSAAALGWCLMLLATAPALQERLRAETRDVIGNRTPTLADIHALPLLAAFECEALRIFPPIPILSRVAVEADEINGICVAAGQKVLLSVIGLHHDREVFPQSRRVSLDRFPGGEPLDSYHGHYLPFGTGRRACGGSRIATIEMTTALALFISRLAFHNPKPEPLAFEWVASLRRRGGQRIGISPA